MAHDNKQKKSLLYRLSWNNNGKQLNNNIGELLGVGQKCIDMWIAGNDNDMDGKKILQNFETIDHILLDLQQCIMNALKPSSLVYNILKDRVEYKNKLSDCQCHTKILNLQERIALDKEKIGFLVRETAILTQEKQNLLKKNEGLEEIFQYKEDNIKKQHKIAIEFLNQKLSDGDKELDDLRCEIRKGLNNLKNELRAVNVENYNLRQRLLKIPALEQNYDQQRQKFILEIRTCQDKIKNYEKNLKNQKTDFKKVNEENQNLKQELSQISSLNQNDFKLKEIEYQTNIDTLEESILYFSNRNVELKQKLKGVKGERVVYNKKIENVTDLDNSVDATEDLNRNRKYKDEDSSANIPAKESNSSKGDKNKTGDGNNDADNIDHEEIQNSDSILTEEDFENVIFDNQTETCSFYSNSGQNKKVIGDKEEID